MATLGFNGKLLRIDLTSKTARAEDLPSSSMKLVLGGKALALKLLSQEKAMGDDPLGPSNKIILSTGLLTATGAPTGAWMSLMARSPLTGLLTASSAGGEFPARLKLSGYDALIVEGKAKEPTTLVIGDEEGDEIHFLSSVSLWGKTVRETDDYFVSRWGRKTEVLSIGPAGERQWKIATPVMDRSRHGVSPGLGAVMGSKNLKAIVAHGDKPLAVADPGGLKLASAQVLEKISQKFIPFRRLSAYGTAHLIHPFNQDKILPTRNFRTGDFEEWEKIDGETIFSSLVSKRTACFSCPIGCRRRSKVDGEFVEGPDFIDLVSFGSLCGNHDVRSIVEARRRSNELGIDPLSMGAAVASVMDLRERGLLSDDDVGFPLGFGNSSGLMGLLAQAEKNEGLGRVLAEDPFQIARNRSSHSIFHIRNQPIGPSHPLRDPLMDLHYRVSNSGTWYLLASGHFVRELEIYDQFGVKDEVSRVRIFQDVMAVMESLGLCEYLLLFLNLKDIASLLSPILGADVDSQGLLQLGGKISDLERRLNLDWDRNRNLTSAVPSWSSEAKDERVSQYFSLRNWDEKGVPKGETEL